MSHAPPSRPPYLFYSPKCPHCQQLIEMIKANGPLSRRIEPINIHTAQSLPPQLKEVPAILYANQLLVGPDTFKWVQFQHQPQERKQEQPMPGHQGQGQDQGQEDYSMPIPSDINMQVKGGIDFTPLPGQEATKDENNLPRFSYLPGEGNSTDGTVGIDYEAAMDVTTMSKKRSDGMAQQLEHMQKLRGMDSEKIQEQYNPHEAGSYESQGGVQRGGYATMNQQGGQQQNSNDYLPKRW